MATITIDTLAHVSIDGIDKGHILDATRNLPGFAADIKAAFDVWYQGVILAFDALGGQSVVADAKKLKRTAELQEVIATAQAELDAITPPKP